jgi:hypothetical protein
MGYDIHGRHPTGAEGKHFRRSTLAWPPLTALCRELVPDISNRCTYWTSNDGDGLDGDAVAELAGRLRELVEDGTISDYINQLRAMLARLPDTTCEICKGSGVITRAMAKTVDLPLGHLNKDRSFVCLPCGGKGAVPKLLACHLLDTEDVEEWIDFLRSCGGFRIR